MIKERTEGGSKKASQLQMFLTQDIIGVQILLLVLSKENIPAMKNFSHKEGCAQVPPLFSCYD